MTSKQIFKFIEKAMPVFREGREKKFEMFTPSTQHIEADTIEELIIRGIEESEKYDYKSPMNYMHDKIEQEIVIEPYTIAYEEYTKEQISEAVDEMIENIRNRRLF